MRGCPPLVYVIGVDALMERAVHADLPDADIRRRRTLRAGVVRRRGPRPDLVVLDVTAADADAELAAIWSAWGEQVVIVGVDRHQPYARIWRQPNLARVAEIGPGFFAAHLPNGVAAAAAATATFD
jgi:hypothetical protein